MRFDFPHVVPLLPPLVPMSKVAEVVLLDVSRSVSLPGCPPETRFTYRLTRRGDKKAGTPREHLVTRPDGSTETSRGEITKAREDRTRLVLGDPIAVEAVRRIFKTYAERNAGFK